MWYLEDITLNDNESPLANPSVRVSIPKRTSVIYIYNPDHVLQLDITAKIFRKPARYDEFETDCTQDPKLACMRLTTDYYAAAGEDPKLVGLYQSMTWPDIHYLGRGKHPPYHDLFGKDSHGRDLVLAGSREAYVQVANAWKAERPWEDILVAAGAVVRDEQEDKSSSTN
jgi:hypothetical protein